MKVIGYGDNVADRYVNQNMMYPGGNCVNFAVYAKKSGVESAYLGCWGADKEAKMIQRALNDIGVDISRCRTETGTVTERCDVNLIHGERIFLQDDDRENLHGAMILTEEEVEYLRGFDLIHCSCYAEEESQLRKLEDTEALITFDFSEEDEYRKDEYLTQVCPHIDFALFSCEHMDNDEIRIFLKRIFEKGVPYVLATMGTRGQILYNGRKYYEGMVRLTEAVDTMGAGDSFFTSFLMSLLKSGWRKNMPMEEKAIREAFEYAAEFSAKNCLISGAFGYGQKIK
ncbi:PfkB family carbohydrate kinase [Clostridium sp. Marseille-P3244]|uniref:PfkB family carbohydrate kinase n=1 Tax=Clostridium sp. Marseille-P3244 TaxID=1871020 RepID=UPI0009301BE5|nr:PfkB family carbohydrate kinase [Clostridium sp. Marseille-P3244]